MIKIETTKMDPKLNFYMLSKEDFASVCFLQIRVPLMLSCNAAEILKKFVYLVVPCARLTKLAC
jgi:hypothetical protein